MFGGGVGGGGHQIGDVTSGAAVHYAQHFLHHTQPAVYAWISLRIENCFVRGRALAVLVVRPIPLLAVMTSAPHTQGAARFTRSSHGLLENVDMI